MLVITDNFSVFLDGFGTTLLVTLASAVGALILGTIIGIFRISPIPALRAFGAAYVELVRNTPLTLIFFFFVFVAPLADITFPNYIFTAIVACSLYTAAFVCEAVRSGVNSVSLGQAEAARAVGLTFGQSLATVVMPQAFRTVIPPLINIFIALAKNTSIGSAFFVTDLTAIGIRVSNQNPASVIWVLIGVAFFYLIITIPAGIFANYLERKLAIAR